jgi:hypothetical protein
MFRLRAVNGKDINKLQQKLFSCNKDPKIGGVAIPAAPKIILP